jgi:hypothetical protein
MRKKARAKKPSTVARGSMRSKKRLPANDGKQLESLVSFVEQSLLPRGFDVKTNTRICNDEGTQIAEFDVEIRGRLGSTDIAWLIECRDRPGEGAAPGSWIEQLVGRKTRFGFNKVSAVSTTGFTAGAIEFARTAGIELRTVADLTSNAFVNWLGISFMVSTKQTAKVHNAKIILDEDTSVEIRQVMDAALKETTMTSPIFRRSIIGPEFSAADAFLGAVNELGLFDNVNPNGNWKPINIDARYSPDSHFFVDTSAGPVAILRIYFEGELQVEVTHLPLERATEYRRDDSGQCISQLAAFAPQDVNGKKVALEFHRIADSGQISVVLRNRK